MLNEKISRILSGSCCPATDLLSACQTGEIEYRDAYEAFNARLPKNRQITSLLDASAIEIGHMKAYDI